VSWLLDFGRRFAEGGGRANDDMLGRRIALGDGLVATVHRADAEPAQKLTGKFPPVAKDAARVDHDEVLPIECFAPGTWAGLTWKVEDLDEMCRNFTALAQYVKPPVKLGHDDKQLLAQTDGQPALGWVKGLRRVGEKLIAEVAGIPNALRQILKQGAYRRVSAEIYPEVEGTSFAKNLPITVRGKALAALAFLGADVPEVKTLDDLQRFLAAERGRPLTLTESACPEGAVACVRPFNASADCDCGLVAFKGKQGNIDGLAQHIVDKYGGEHPFSECMAAEELKNYDAETREQICGRVKALAKTKASERSTLVALSEQAKRLRIEVEAALGKSNGAGTLSDRPVTFGGFDLTIAALVSSKAHTAMDACEAVLEREGWNRDDTTLRAKALATAIAEAAAKGVDIDPGEQDRQRIVYQYARSEMPKGVSPTGQVGSARANTQLGEALERIALREHLDLDVPADVGKATTILCSERPDLVRQHYAPPSPHVLEFGEARWQAMEELATRESRDITRKHDRAVVFAVLMKESPHWEPEVSTAESFNLCLRAIARRDRLDVEGKPADRREACLRVFKERPDLCGRAYGDQEARRKRLSEPAADTTSFDTLVLAAARKRGITRPGPTATRAQVEQWRQMIEFVAASMKGEES